jgi:ribosomal protein S18 acetylase RimI-like enzyme
MHPAGRHPTDPGGGSRSSEAVRESSAPVYKVGPLKAGHRDAVEEIVRATGVFHEREVGIAVEVFDETYGRKTARAAARSARSGAAVARDESGASDYEFLGLFNKANRLVGYACFGPTPGTDRGYDLYWIAVNPAAQGGGGGTFLIGEVERQLRERNARFVLAETSSRAEYAATRAFYAARGYIESARVRDFYGAADDLVLFTKRLQPAPRARGGSEGKVR